MTSKASESKAMLALTVSLTPSCTSNQPINSIVPDISQHAISAAKNNGRKVATCAQHRALLVQSAMCSTLLRIWRMILMPICPTWMRMKIGKTKSGTMKTGRSGLMRWKWRKKWMKQWQNSRKRRDWQSLKEKVIKEEELVVKVACSAFVSSRETRPTLLNLMTKPLTMAPKVVRLLAHQALAMRIYSSSQIRSISILQDLST